MASILDIARYADVSAENVLRVVNGEPVSEDIAQRVTQHVEPDHDQADCKAGIQHQPRRREQEGAPLIEHCAPLGPRRLHAETQEVQSGNGQNQSSHV